LCDLAIYFNHKTFVVVSLLFLLYGYMMHCWSRTISSAWNG